MAVSEKELRSVCDIGRYCNNVTVLTRKKKSQQPTAASWTGKDRGGLGWRGPHMSHGNDRMVPPRQMRNDIRVVHPA